MAAQGGEYWAALALPGPGPGRQGCRAEETRRAGEITCNLSMCWDGAAAALQGLSGPLHPSGLQPSLEPVGLMLPWQHWPEVLLRAGWAG